MVVMVAAAVAVTVAVAVAWSVSVAVAWTEAVAVAVTMAVVWKVSSIGSSQGSSLGSRSCNCSTVDHIGHSDRATATVTVATDSAKPILYSSNSSPMRWRV